MSDPVPAPHALAVMLADREKEVRASRPQPEKEEKTRMLPRPTVTEKKCPRCETVKPADAFTRAKRTATGLASYCKVCTATIQRERYNKSKKAKQPKKAEAPPDPRRDGTSSPEQPTSEPEPALDPSLSERWLRRLRIAATDPTLSQIKALAAFLDCEPCDVLELCEELTADA